MEHPINSLLVLLLTALVIAAMWRFLLGVALLALSVFIWVSLAAFCLGAIQGYREITERGGVA